jgi:hypothetical protein
MSKSRNPTVYLFVNKDSASASLSRSHGKDASAILSHVQSCRNQKNRQLHMFRVEDGPSEPSTPQSPSAPTFPYQQNSPKPTLRTETSSGSARSVSLSPTTTNDSSSPRSSTEDRPEVEELVDYFDNLCMESSGQSGIDSHSYDMYRQIVSTEEFRNFSGRIPRGTHGYAMLACTAARMAVDAPERRDEFEIKATKYMQPSLQCLREQLTDSRARTLTDRQILQEMLLHCVTNWYIGDIVAAQTHLNAMSCFIGCLNVSTSADRVLMDIINRCGLSVANARRTGQTTRCNAGQRRQSTVDRSLSRVV